MSELLPCPFCGGPAIEFGSVNANRVSCNYCKISIHQSELGMGDAAAVWNRRAQPTDSAALRDALKGAQYVLENVQGDINPERGYAEELEEEITLALAIIHEAIAQQEANHE